MLKALLPYVVPAITGFASWVFAFFYYRKERKNDLSAKLLQQIDELSRKYVELSDKYVRLHSQMCKLQQENILLREAVRSISFASEENGKTTTKR